MAFSSLCVMRWLSAQELKQEVELLLHVLDSMVFIERVESELNHLKTSPLPGSPHLHAV